MSQSFKHITLIAVTGLPDARGEARALQWSLEQMPGAQAVLCSPSAPPDLHRAIAHRAIAPMNYHEYSWFMMFALWRVVPTEFALVVQEDGWVVNAANWQDAFLACDYIGAPIHLARVVGPEGVVWRNRFDWTADLRAPDRTVTPVQNGGFSLRSQRFMRALVEHPQIRVEIPPPDAVEGEPLGMRWHHNALLEDVQLSGVLRPALEAVGLRFAPLELARDFAIEHAGGEFHHGYNALSLFGHHAKVRKLVSLAPLTLHCAIAPSQLDHWYGERDILAMFERYGYRIEFAPEPMAGAVAAPTRRVYDCFQYNGEADVLAIRLHELDAVVDRFVLVEATLTHSGLPKPIHFDAADPRFVRFASRIRHVVVDDFPATDDAWVREMFQRDAVLRGLAEARDDDLVMISDADEIPRADIVRELRDDRENDAFGLGLALYYFYANYRNVEGPEAMTVWSVAATRARLAQTTPSRLRLDVRSGDQPARLVADAGWHLSYLMDDASVRSKIAAFAHQEYNDPDFLAAIDIPALIARGGDLYGREGVTWRVVGRDEAPAWLASRPELERLFVPSSAENVAVDS